MKIARSRVKRSAQAKCLAKHGSLPRRTGPAPHAVEFHAIMPLRLRRTGVAPVSNFKYPALDECFGRLTVTLKSEGFSDGDRRDACPTGLPSFDRRCCFALSRISQETRHGKGHPVLKNESRRHQRRSQQFANPFFQPVIIERLGEEIHDLFGLGAFDHVI